MAILTSLIREKIIGLCGVAVLALVSFALANTSWFTHLGISSLVIAIILGIMIGNIWHHPPSWNAGIQFSAKRILRLAIILYGFRVSFQQIASVGLQAFCIDVCVVTSTLLLGYWVGRKIFKLDRQMALLISTGSAICGAAAVLAVEDILKSEPYKTAVAIGTVVLFGTLSMFLYPLLQHANFFGFATLQFGVFAGASVHEVAQALVTGANVSSEAGKIAVIVKMIRVLMLVPALLILSYTNNRVMQQSGSQKFKLVIPWFAIGFALVIGFNSLALLPDAGVALINQVDIFLLTMAMGAIGMETKLAKIKKVGLQPLYLAVVLFAWLMGSVWVMVKVAG